MTQNAIVDLTSGEWTELTSGEVTAITFQNLGMTHVKIAGTVDATAPASDAGFKIYAPLEGETNTDLGDMFPGIDAVRVWAWAESKTPMFVSDVGVPPSPPPPSPPSPPEDPPPEEP